MKRGFAAILGVIALAVLALALALARASSERPAPSGADPDPERREAEKIVFLLQYIGVDYGGAVQDERIADPYEFQEMAGYSTAVLERYEALRGDRASKEIVADMKRLGETVRDLRPWPEVRLLSRTLVAKVSEELGTLPFPTVTPDLEQGRELFTRDCAACHGAKGGGDGRAAAGMDPSPSSFREAERMNLLSPHQVAGAVEFGIEGTAMPSYRGVYNADQLWNLAFFVFTLRADFDPQDPEEALPLSLGDLAERSNDELLERLKTDRPWATPKHLDYQRAHPPEAHPHELRWAAGDDKR